MDTFKLGEAEVELVRVFADVLVDFLCFDIYH